MQKHRKKRHYKKATIAAVTLGVMGIPTAAMACLDLQEEPRTVRAADRWTPAPSLDLPAPETALPVLGDRAAHTDRSERRDGVREQDRRPAATPHTRQQTPPPARPVTRPAPRPTASAPSVPSAPVTAPKPTSPAPTTASGPTARVVALVNVERAKAGCPALTVNAKLTAAAQGHSKDMAAHGNMSHTGSDGSDPGTRITRAGYAWSTYGENVAYGYGTPEQVMAGWMNSPGHRRNILNCSFKEIGVGLAQPGNYWTQNFGAAR
ncbi:CAP domain-containing protein [Streptomyces sp. NPDC012888]|uniref:CAP domain-containing protein n=1 Tax=Streptomyces sp. NPDC012888 TaxID=3364855 RepID=UPI0036B6EC57